MDDNLTKLTRIANKNSKLSNDPILNQSLIIIPSQPQPFNQNDDNKI